jgi:hypothetical protein
MVHHRSNYYRNKENVTRLYRRPGKLTREYETHLINPPLQLKKIGWATKKIGPFQKKIKTPILKMGQLIKFGTLF